MTAAHRAARNSPWGELRQDSEGGFRRRAHIARYRLRTLWLEPQPLRPSLRSRPARVDLAVRWTKVFELPACINDLLGCKSSLLGPLTQSVTSGPTRLIQPQRVVDCGFYRYREGID